MNKSRLTMPELRNYLNPEWVFSDKAIVVPSQNYFGVLNDLPNFSESTLYEKLVLLHFGEEDGKKYLQRSKISNSSKNYLNSLNHPLTLENVLNSPLYLKYSKYFQNEKINFEDEEIFSRKLIEAFGGFDDSFKLLGLNGLQDIDKNSLLRKLNSSMNLGSKLVLLETMGNVLRKQNDRAYLELNKSIILDQENYSSFLDYMKSVKKIFDENMLVLRGDGPIREYRNKLINMHKTETEKGYKNYIGTRLYETFLFDHERSAKLIELKMKRFEELLKVDKNIALMFIKFNPSQFIALENLTSEEPESNPSEVMNKLLKSEHREKYWQEDNKLYQSILDLFETEENLNIIQFKPRYSTELNGPNIELKHVKERLTRSIIHNHPKYFSEDNLVRIDYFVDDISDKIPLSKLKDLSRSFNEFDLTNRIKDINVNKNELRFRNFFDDIMIKYVIKQQTLRGNDLEHLWKHSLNEKL